MRYVVTGGMGFFGSVLMDFLVKRGDEAISIDCLPEPGLARRFRNLSVDIADGAHLEKAISALGQVDGIFHAAAVLAHDKTQFPRLWASNVGGTQNVMAVAKTLNIPKVVFTSSNCVFATGVPHPVDETFPTSPIEEYGRSKLAGEELITGGEGAVAGVVIRCPTIIAAGRLGLLTILFDFVREGRRLYLVGDGNNRYSFIYALDLAQACYLAMRSDHAGIYHVGSDRVPSIRELYTDLCTFAGKTARLVTIPELPTIAALKCLNALNLSPLGPYHYRMLAANFVFDTGKIKRDLNWAPTKTNSQMLCDAYQYYVDHLGDIEGASGLSPHRSKAKAGILNLLRLIS